MTGRNPEGDQENDEADARKSGIERLVFRRIELWVVGLLGIASLIFTIGFGVVVRNEALGHGRFGEIGKVAFAVAEMPATIQKMTQAGRQMHAIEGGKRFAGRRGWYPASDAAVSGLEGYMLLSRFDGDANRHVVDLVDLSTFKTVFTWKPDAEFLFGAYKRCAVCQAPIENKTFRVIHPLAFPNGDLLVKDHQSPLARINACGKPIWLNDGVFHHATSLDENGDIWSPGFMRGTAEKPVNGHPDDYYDDAIIHLTSDGKTVEKFDLTQVIKDSGYRYMLGGMEADYHHDPIHLNDVQPVMSDGKYWKKGDVFLSMRHKSAIALFRPSTARIVWLKLGPWMMQHDVDIVADGKISVFNNGFNRVFEEPPKGTINQVLVYDFDTDTVSSHDLGALRELDIKTETEGLQSLLPGGFLMVEETNYGRLAIIGPDGHPAAEYINGANDGFDYQLGWSRYVPKDLGDKIVAATRNLHCGN